MQFVPGAMRDQDEQDRKKPRPIAIGRKGESLPEAQEHGAREVGPDRAQHGARHHHVHVRC